MKYRFVKNVPMKIVEINGCKYFRPLLAEDQLGKLTQSKTLSIYMSIDGKKMLFQAPKDVEM